MRFAWRISLFCPLMALAALLACSAGISHAGGITYNVNEAFVANELGGPSNPNGPYTYGYNYTPSNPSTISTAGMVHTGSSGFNNTDPAIQGYYIPNNVIVPAVVGNISNSVVNTNFGTTLQPHELLLHPGSTDSNGFDQPAAYADLQYTVAKTGQSTISGYFEALSTGGTDVHVYVNGTSLFDANVTAQGQQAAFSLTPLLHAGDKVDFLVGQGPDGDIGSDSTGLFANIAQASPVPEPASMTLVGMAALSLAGFGLRRRRTS